jgi:hypothetical protein
MGFFLRKQNDWSGFEKTMAIIFFPFLQVLAWLYVHYVSSHILLSEATTMEVILGFICNFSPIVLLPAWGWVLTLFIFNKPVNRNISDESNRHH